MFTLTLATESLETIWTRSRHVCRILTTAPLTPSNDAWPSVCLPGGDFKMAQCCVPFALCHSGPGFTKPLTNGREQGTFWKVVVQHYSLHCWEEGREEGWAHYSFSPHREVYLSAAALEGSQSSLTTEDVFSLCEHQSLWYSGKCFFLFFFSLLTPNCCLWEASVKKVVQSPKRKIEDKR